MSATPLELPALAHNVRTRFRSSSSTSELLWDSWISMFCGILQARKYDRGDETGPQDLPHTDIIDCFGMFLYVVD